MSGPVCPSRPSDSSSIRGEDAGQHGHLTARAGAFSHADLVRAMHADLGLGLRHQTSWGLAASSELTLGGMLGASPSREFAADGQGVFEARDPRIRPQARIGARLALGARLGESPTAPSLMLHHHAWVSAPFAPDFIPFMLHGETGLTLRLPLVSGRRS